MEENPSKGHHPLQIPGDMSGHIGALLGAPAGGGIGVITWGGVKWMTWAFFHAYVPKVLAVVSADSLDANGKTPLGYDLSTLVAATKQWAMPQDNGKHRKRG
jgi:hypothetical protein